MSLEIRISKEPMLPPGPEPEDREIDGIIYAPYGLPIWWQVDDSEGFEYGYSYAPSRLVAYREVALTLWGNRKNIIYFAMADLTKGLPGRLVRLAGWIDNKRSWLNGFGRDT